MTWFAIRCAPQREIAVEAMLRRKGYDVFLPTEVKSRRVGGSTYQVPVEVPQRLVDRHPRHAERGAGVGVAGRIGGHGPDRRAGLRRSQPRTAAARASARSVRSQVISGSSRPKWP